MNSQMILSIVVPIYNEAESISGLHREILEMCRHPHGCSTSFDWEIIFVDDGSEDGTGDICKELTPLRYIHLDENQGQTAALDCAFKAAKGDYIAALDGDGQNDPADIPRMLQHLLDHDLDVVCGWRKNRRDTLSKHMASRLAYVIRQVLVHDGVHDSGCTLKVFRKKCFDGLTLKGGQHRFIPAILKYRGYKIGEIEVNHRPRQYGVSKYHFSRVFQGLNDLFEIRKEYR